jgi:hypothetical protein
MSSKSTPYFYKNPLITSLTFSFWRELSILYFTVKTYLEVTKLASLGGITSSYVLFVVSAFSSLLIVSYHLNPYSGSATAS